MCISVNVVDTAPFVSKNKVRLLSYHKHFSSQNAWWRKPWHWLKCSKSDCQNFSREGRKTQNCFGGKNWLWFKQAEIFDEKKCPKLITETYFSLSQYQGPHDESKMIPTGIAEVGNGTATFEKQRATGNLIAIFNSYQLRKVERIMNERIGKEERVTDQKYAMVYYTRVRVMNQDYQLKVCCSFVKCICCCLVCIKD